MLLTDERLATREGSIRLTDGVISALQARLAAVPPERGGALLAVGDLVHLFVEDTAGRCSGTSWDISAELSSTVGLLEQGAHGILAGTVHSHPSGLPDPSASDVRTTSDALEMNSHLGALLIGVITAGRPRQHDLAVGSDHRMSLHLLRRHPRGGPSDPVRIPGQIVPLTEDLALAGGQMLSVTTVEAWLDSGGGARHGVQLGPLPHVIRLCGRPRLTVTIPADRNAALLLDPEYPVVGPVAITVRRGEDGNPTVVPLPSPWDPVSPPAPQLAGLVRRAAGRSLVGAHDRVWPLAGDLAHRRVLVSGLGSVGSLITEDLVRCGVGALTVVDPETVEAPNLSRTVYVAADVGTPKPDALQRRLSSIDPAVAVEGHRLAIGATNIDELLTDVDLVVAATDDMTEQALLAHHAYAAGVPLVACALYRGAAAGEVVLSVPAAGTACWACAVGGSAPAATYRPDKDYGIGGRLVGEAALGPAVHLVANVATAMAVGLLAGPHTVAGERLGPLLADRRTLGLVATAPHWEFFSDVFDGMHHQFAPQSIWVKVETDPACPVCGQDRVAPQSAAAGAILEDLLHTLSPRAATTIPESSASDTDLQ